MKDYRIFPFCPFLFPSQRAEVTTTFLLPLALHGKVLEMVWQGPLATSGVPASPCTQTGPLTSANAAVRRYWAHSHRGLANHPRSTKRSSDNGGNRVSETQHVSVCALVEEELSVQFYVCVLQRWCWFLHDNMPFPWPFHTTISVKQGNNHAGYQICSGGFKYFRGSICEAKCKEKFKSWSWDRICNSLYQIQTMQPKDSMFLMVTESSLYQDCSKHFERAIAVQDIHWNWIRYFLSAQLSCTICLPNTGSQLRSSGPLDSVGRKRPLPFLRADYWFQRCSIRKQFLQVYREERPFD